MKSHQIHQGRAPRLSRSESLLIKQRQELQRTNEQLKEKARQLSEQVRQVEYKSAEVELAKTAYQEKAEQLAQSSRYKTQFLANMSHELRTPLNSLLILAQLLADNSTGNLTAKQVEYARTIFASGNQLLALISDVLDLAKIESGTIGLNVATAGLAELRDDIEHAFRQLAVDKGLKFEIPLADDLPASIRTDLKRLRQILQNLLSNAFKFTSKGRLTLQISRATFGWTPGHPVLDHVDEVIAFSVSDTGIGIPPEKQKIIFEAFQQADGSTSRQFGGTGLGLSISAELAALLSGEIHVRSTPGAGSTFTLFLPIDAGLAHPPLVHDEANGSSEDVASALPPEETKKKERRPRALPEPDLRDDRNDIRAGDDIALIVGSACRFAGRLLVLVREAGLKALVCSDADAAVSLSKKFASHAVAVCFDGGRAPDWAIAERIRRESPSRHIPLSLICMDPRDGRHLLIAGTVVPHGPLQDAIADAATSWQGVRPGGPKTFLVVESNAKRRREMVSSIDFHGARVFSTSSGAGAASLLADSAIDCLLTGPDGGKAMKLLRDVWAAGRASQVATLYRAGDEASVDAPQLMILRPAASPEGAIREAALSLHRARVESAAVAASARVDRAATSLAGRRVLIIDDDIRNIFAMTSALEHYGMVVENAETGIAGIETLKQNRGIDVVLLDMMLPGLDGYQTIRVIRDMESFKSLPIIAVTARAMKEDRGKCIEAGASDYAAKPVVMSDLLSRMRTLLESADRRSRELG